MIPCCKLLFIPSSCVLMQNTTVNSGSLDVFSGLVCLPLTVSGMQQRRLAMMLMQKDSWSLRSSVIKTLNVFFCVYARLALNRKNNTKGPFSRHLSAVTLSLNTRHNSSSYLSIFVSCRWGSMAAVAIKHWIIVAWKRNMEAEFCFQHL